MKYNAHTLSKGMNMNKRKIESGAAVKDIFADNVVFLVKIAKPIRFLNHGGAILSEIDRPLTVQWTH